jgi:NAD-dependent SIR2 family protein deacetylase
VRDIAVQAAQAGAAQVEAVPCQPAPGHGRIDYIQCSRCGKYEKDRKWIVLPIRPEDANSIGWMSCPVCKQKLIEQDAAAVEASTSDGVVLPELSDALPQAQ